MFKYAQIDKDGYIVGVSFLNGEVKKDLMIPLSEDEDVSGKMYKNGVWIDDDRETQETPEQTEKDDTTLAIMDAQAEMYENQLAIQENQLNLMDAIANLYEMLSDMQAGNSND